MRSKTLTTMSSQVSTIRGRGAVLTYNSDEIKDTEYNVLPGLAVDNHPAEVNT